MVDLILVVLEIKEGRAAVRERQAPAVMAAELDKLAEKLVEDRQ